MKKVIQPLILVFLLFSYNFSQAESITELYIQLDRTHVYSVNSDNSTAGVEARVRDKVSKKAKFYQNDKVVSTDRLMVIGKEENGREIYRQVVDNPLLMHAETFNPKTGEIESAEEIVRDKGTLRLDIPDQLDIQTLELNTIHKQGSSYQFNLLQRIKLEKSHAASSLNMDAQADNGIFSVTQSGDSQNRVDLVLLSEGYTASELGKFEEDVRQIVDGYFKENIYNEYKNHFNVWRVEVASNQSGAGNGQPIDTKFGGYRNCYNIERLLCVDEDKVMNYLKSIMPANAMDKILVVVNTEDYGGSGGQVAAISLAPESIYLALHEMGHSFANLADEYAIGDCRRYEPNKANATADSTGAKWQHWSDVDTNIGVYEGSMYCARDMYRPTQNSMMKELGQPFYAVNESEIVRRIYSFVEVIDAVSPEQTDISMNMGESKEFTIMPVDTASNTVQTIWYLNDQQVGEGSNFIFNSSNYQEGVYNLKAVTSDETSHVIKDPNQLLVSQYTWIINLGESAPTCIEAPATPSGLTTGDIDSMSFSFNWDRVSTAESYRTDIWNESDSKWEVLEETTDTSVSMTGLEPGSTQWVRVSARNTCGDSNPSEYITVQLINRQTCSRPPGIPGAFTASGVTNGRFTLSWSQADGASTYRIQKWTGREWQDYQDTDVTSLIITSTRGGITEYYSVYALNQCGGGPSTNWLMVVIPQKHSCTSAPAKPTGLQASYIDPTQFGLSWPKVAGATQYEVQTWDGYAGIWKSYQSTQQHDVDFYQLQRGSIYYSRIVAKNSCGSSTPSDYLAVRLPQ